MRHTNTIALLTYWNSRRGQRPYPSRSEIEPADISKLLPNMLVGEITGNSDRLFRLAGTAICALAARELKGTEICDLWLADNRRNTANILRAVHDGLPAVMSLDGLSCHGRVLQAEAIFLPLGDAEGNCNRLLGAISVFDPPYWIGHEPLAGFSTTGFRLIDLEESDSLSAHRMSTGPLPVPAASQQAPFGQRNRDRFFVIDGGKD